MNELASVTQPSPNASPDAWERLHALRQREMELEESLTNAELSSSEAVATLQEDLHNVRHQIHDTIPSPPPTERTPSPPKIAPEMSSSREASSLPSIQELRAAEEAERADTLRSITLRKKALEKKLQTHQLHKDPAKAHPDVTAAIGEELEDVASSARNLLMQPPSEKTIASYREREARSSPSNPKAAAESGGGLKGLLSRLIGHDPMTQRSPKMHWAVEDATKAGIRNAQELFDAIASHLFDLSFGADDYLNQMIAAKEAGQNSQASRRLNEMDSELLEYGLDVRPSKKLTSRRASQHPYADM
jgi:hypothetical protein